MMLNNLFKKLLGGENQTRNQVLNRPQSQVPYAPQQAPQQQPARGLQNNVNPVDPQFGAVGDYGRFQSLQAPRTYWQNTDGIRRNMVNPQLSDLDEIELQGQGLRNYFNF